VLKKYHRIGWDFDGTLVGHQKSFDIWNFIDENPYGQEHFIITHRSHGLEKRMFDQLVEEGSMLTPGHFTQIFNVTDTMHAEFERNKPNKLFIMPEDLSNDPYVQWKGLICHQNNIQVMIDDDPDIVIHGCLKYDIDFINVDKLCL